MMKKYLFYLLCTVLATSVSAQKKVDETCETKLKRTETQLRQENASKQTLLDSIREFNITLQNLQHDYSIMEEELIVLNATLDERELELKNALLVIKSQGSEVERRLKESYEAKLKDFDAEKLKAQNELSKTKQELTRVEKENNQLLATIFEIQRTFPFIVTDMKFQNTNKKGKIINNYDERLCGKDMKWLTSKIYYTGLVEVSKNIALRVKIFKSDGTLLKESKSYTTYSTDVLYATVSRGKGYIILNPWVSKGNSIFPSGKLKAGEYRMEIWHNDVCLGSKTLKIY